MALEPLAEADVILAIAGDRLYTCREALAAPPAVEHGDVMASRQERCTRWKLMNSVPPMTSARMTAGF